MKHPAFRYLILAGILSASPALAADEGGLPQMDVHTYPSQLFWLFVCFVTLYIVFSRVSLPRIGETLERRAARKDSDLQQASEWNHDAGHVKAEYERTLERARATATANLAAAERDVSTHIADEQAKFADSARKRLTSAEQGIAKAKAEALASLSDISADLTTEIVQKIAGIKIEKTDARKAVTTAMQETK